MAGGGGSVGTAVGGTSVGGTTVGTTTVGSAVGGADVGSPGFGVGVGGAWVDVGSPGSGVEVDAIVPVCVGVWVGGGSGVGGFGIWKMRIGPYVQSAGKTAIPECNGSAMIGR